MWTITTSLLRLDAKQGLPPWPRYITRPRLWSVAWVKWVPVQCWMWWNGCDWCWHMMQVWQKIEESKHSVYWYLEECSILQDGHVLLTAELVSSCMKHCWNSLRWGKNVSILEYAVYSHSELSELPEKKCMYLFFSLDINLLNIVFIIPFIINKTFHRLGVASYHGLNTGICNLVRLNNRLRACSTSIDNVDSLSLCLRQFEKHSLAFTHHSRWGGGGSSGQRGHVTESVPPISALSQQDFVFVDLRLIIRSWFWDFESISNWPWSRS